MRIVIALGSGALRGDRDSCGIRQATPNLTRIAAGIAEITAGHDVAILHGHGTQIARAFERQLMNVMGHTRVTTVLAQVEVDRYDPAFDHPEKPIGPAYQKAEARALAATHGWTISARGEHWRRVVAAPPPRYLIGLSAIEQLLLGKFVVACAIDSDRPVQRAPDGKLEDAICAVDTDLIGALLAENLHADLLLSVADVERMVAVGAGARQHPLQWRRSLARSGQQHHPAVFREKPR